MDRDDVAAPAGEATIIDARVAADAAARPGMRSRPRTLPPVIRGTASPVGPGRTAWPGEEPPAADPPVVDQPAPPRGDSGIAPEPGPSAGATNDTASRT
ncbi:MAG: hypothetical protein ACRYGC_14765 [Janthinobacterium lividum]